LKYDGTGGLNVHQCATDRGGTPEHLQKEHKPQRRLPEYPIGGTHWARLRPGDVIPGWKVEHPGVAMGYTQAEMDDVCPGCGGWEWCWCYTGLGEEVDGLTLEQENYRVWAERYEALQGASGSSLRSQGNKSTGGASGSSQRRSDDARVTKRKPKKPKVKLGRRDEASTQVHQSKAAKTSHKGGQGGSDLITELVGEVLKSKPSYSLLLSIFLTALDHYQQKGKQLSHPANDLNQPQQLASQPKAAPNKSKAKLGTGNDHLAQARQWRADLLAKNNAGLPEQGDLVSVEADLGTDLRVVVRDNVDKTSANLVSSSEDRVQSLCKESPSSGMAKRVRFSPLDTPTDER
jgi:hypothetical protein